MSFYSNSNKGCHSDRPGYVVEDVEMSTPKPLGAQMWKDQPFSYDGEIDTGCRIWIPSLGAGTVVRYLEDVDKLIVCMDDSTSGESMSPDLAGPRHGHLVALKEVAPRVGAGSTEDLSRLPSFVHIRVREPFQQDSVAFEEGDIGRPIRFKPSGRSGGAYVLIKWSHSHHAFYLMEGQDNCYKVPAGFLEWVIVDNLGIRTWPSRRGPVGKHSLKKKKKKQSFLTGEIVRYKGGGFSVPNPESKRSASLGDGTLLRILATEKGSYTAEIVGCCPVELLGQYSVFPAGKFTTYEGEVFLPGQLVEIVGSVMFSGRELDGMKGEVLLPIDLDRDVGVEFEEEIRKAGSLDGHGVTGRCLYIPAPSLKKV